LLIPFYHKSRGAATPWAVGWIKGGIHLKRILLAGNIILYTVLLCLLIISICQHRPNYTSTSTKYETYTVRPGDTLWSISSEYTDGDPRELIYEIEKLNDTTADIRPGQVLKIPASK
jgi:nucleoid-associated protein YgaU